MLDAFNMLMEGAANGFVCVVAVLWLRDRARLHASHRAQLAVMQRLGQATADVGAMMAPPPGRPPHSDA